MKYYFLLWNDYVKSAFIQLTSNVDNASNDELNYWYKAIEIKGDSMRIKSIPKAVVIILKIINMSPNG